MNRKELEAKVESYLEPILEELQFALVDVEYVKEGPTYYLRIYIDKEGGINITDCQITSRRIEQVLDEKDLIKEAYQLEVSSPGLDRVLKKDREFAYFNGRDVDIKLYKAVNGEKTFTGTLVDKKDNTLVLKVDDETIEYDMKDIAVVRLAVTF